MAETSHAVKPKSKPKPKSSSRGKEEAKMDRTSSSGEKNEGSRASAKVSQESRSHAGPVASESVKQASPKLTDEKQRKKLDAPSQRRAAADGRSQKQKNKEGNQRRKTEGTPSHKTGGNPRQQEQPMAPSASPKPKKLRKSNSKPTEKQSQEDKDTNNTKLHGSNSSSSSMNSYRISYDGAVTPTSSVGSKECNDDKDAAPNNDLMEKGAATTPSETTKNEETIYMKGRADESERTSCLKRRGTLLCCIVVLLVAATAAVVVPVFILGDKSGSSDGVLRLSEYPRNQVVAQVPTDLCNEWVPGGGKSEICSAEQTANQGGDVCNILAQAMLNTSRRVADIAIVNAGVCTNDIAAGDMKAADIQKAIEAEQLYLVEMSGLDIELLLEQALESAFGGGSGDGDSAYPYAAGLRFDVQSHLEFGSRAEKIEAILDLVNDFRGISYRKFYTIITTKELASGNLGYSQFGKVIDSWKTPLPYQTVDAFLTYADSNEDWSMPKAEVYSTQSFVPPDTEPVIADIPSDICLGWTPAAGSPSSVCSQGTAVVGGGVCNFVAWALLDQNLQANIAILNSGVCGAELLAGDFTASRASALLPTNPSLVTVRLTGSQIVNLLEEALEAFIVAGTEEAYPFCSALRFDIRTSAAKGERFTNLEFFTTYNRWVPLELGNTYTVLTTSDLAGGNIAAYSLFQEADPSSSSDVRRGSVDALLKFARDWEVLYEPPREKHATQSFS